MQLVSIQVVDADGNLLGTMDLEVDLDIRVVRPSNVRPENGTPTPPLPAEIPYFTTPQTDDAALAAAFDGHVSVWQLQAFRDGSFHLVGDAPDVGDVLWFQPQSAPAPAPAGPVPPFTPCFRDATGKLFDPSGRPLT